MRYNKSSINRSILSMNPSSWFDGMSDTSFLRDIDGYVYRWNNKVSNEYFYYANGEKRRLELNEKAKVKMFCNESNVNTNYLHANFQPFYGDRTVVIAVAQFAANIAPIYPGPSVPVGVGLDPGLVDVTIRGNRYSISHGRIYYGADPKYPGSGLPMEYVIDHVYPDSFSQRPHNALVLGAGASAGTGVYAGSYKLHAPYTMFSVCFISLASDGGISFSFNMASDRISFGPMMQFESDGQWPPVCGEHSSINNAVNYSTIFGNVLYGMKRMSFGGIADLLIFDRALSYDERLSIFSLVRTKYLPQFLPEVIPGNTGINGSFIEHTIDGQSITAINDTTVEIASRITKKSDPTLILVDSKRIGRL